MTEVLLTELSNADIDWMLMAGRSVEIAADTILSQPGQPLEMLYILLEGTLTASLAQTDRPAESSPSAWEIARLSSGAMVGALPGLETYLPDTTVQALTPALVLAIPRSHLLERLQDDLNFAAHLYRASAVLLANQLEQLMGQFQCSALSFQQPQLREAVTVFAELQDSDLDWLTAAGRVQQVTANSVLVRCDRPIDALHILLDGAVALSAPDLKRNRLAHAFSAVEHAHPETEFARLSRGDMVGEMRFVNACAADITVKTLRESQVLSIPYWRLAAKLLHDPGFAARFYRVLAVLIANKQQAIVQQLGGSRLTQTQGQALTDSNGNDLSSQFLTQVALAEARFEWMLKRTRIQVGSGREHAW